MLPKPRKTKTAPQIKPKSDITTIINAFFTPNRHNSSGHHMGSGVHGKFVNTTFKNACSDFAIKIFIHQFQEKSKTILVKKNNRSLIMSSSTKEKEKKWQFFFCINNKTKITITHPP